MRLRVATDADLSRLLFLTHGSCARVGLSRGQTIQVATAVSELGHNIMKYAGSGFIQVRALADPVGVEIIADDTGPGIENCDDALRDHFSTGGTLGLGLPGVRRMMDSFEIDSRPGVGTRVAARKYL